MYLFDCAGSWLPLRLSLLAALVGLLCHWGAQASLWWLLLSRAPGSRHAASVAEQRGSAVVVPGSRTLFPVVMCLASLLPSMWGLPGSQVLSCTGQADSSP